MKSYHRFRHFGLAPLLTISAFLVIHSTKSEGGDDPKFGGKEFGVKVKVTKEMIEKGRPIIIRYAVNLNDVPMVVTMQGTKGEKFNTANVSSSDQKPIKLGTWKEIKAPGDYFLVFATPPDIKEKLKLESLTIYFNDAEDDRSIESLTIEGENNKKVKVSYKLKKNCKVLLQAMDRNFATVTKLEEGDKVRAVAHATEWDTSKLKAADYIIQLEATAVNIETPEIAYKPVTVK